MRRFLVRWGRVGLAVGVVLLLAGLAHATTYTSEVDFSAALAALGGAPSQTLNFEGLAAGTTIPNNGNEGGITFTYSISDINGPLALQVRNDFGTTSPSNYLGLNDGGGTFLSGDSFAMGFGGQVTALGLYVIGGSGANIPGDFELTDGTESVTNTTPDKLLSDGDAYFLGIIDLTGFGSADLISGLISGQYVWNVDDITTSRSGAPVPEPSTLFLLGSGLVGVGGVAWRRKRPD